MSQESGYHGPEISEPITPIELVSEAGFVAAQEGKVSPDFTPSSMAERANQGGLEGRLAPAGIAKVLGKEEVWQQADSLERISELRQAGGAKRVAYDPSEDADSLLVADIKKYREECAAQDPPMEPRILFITSDAASVKIRRTLASSLPNLEVKGLRADMREIPETDVAVMSLPTLIKKLDKFGPQDFEYVVYHQLNPKDEAALKEVVRHLDPLFEAAVVARPEREKSRAVADAGEDSLSDASDLAKRWGINISTAHRVVRTFRAEHPGEELATKKQESTGRNVPIFNERQVTLMEEKYGFKAPEGSLTLDELAEKWDKNPTTTRFIVARFRENHPDQEIKRYSRGGGAQPAMRVTKEQIEAMEAERSLAPPTHKNSTDLAERWGITLGRANQRIADFFDQHPNFEKSEFYNPHWGRNSVYLGAEHLALLEKELGINIEDEGLEPPEGSKTNAELAEEWGLFPQTVSDAAAVYREKNPEQSFYTGRNSNNRRVPIHTPDQIEEIKKELGINPPPAKAKNFQELADEWDVELSTIYRWAERFTDLYPDQEIGKYTRPGTIREIAYLTSEQISLLREVGLERHRKLGQQAVEQANQQELENNIKEFVLDVEKGESLAVQEFTMLVGLFGAERAVDILYQQHPEYRKLPVPYVKSTLADYLGGFLAIKGGFSLGALEKGAPFLVHGVFRDGLTEVIKNDCLRLLNDLSKTDPEQVTIDSVADYIDHIRQETSDFANPHLAEVLDEVEAYYQLLFENIHKPARFVDELEEGRFFPDINQRINVQEIAFKKKVLIGDDMGTGKSASAIMAKEIIGAQQALIIVPSNVLTTWQKYLSDRVGEDGEQIGYFKPGQAPNVLVVESLEALQVANPEDYDYILISQERLNDKYVSELEGFDYDMLIVDEMHKLKNITSGKRAENLVRLAEQIDGEDRYLALLSGTPVPNKISDVAITLKLLYPERFGHIDNKKLVSQILDGDMLDLRSLLVPRMQMKSLAESVDMPELEEKIHLLELSDQEKEIYEVLIEQDELTATEKLTILRQFLMNPQLLDATPNIMGTKVHEVGAALRQTFSEKDRVVTFVNSYVEGVIRGDNTIIEELNIPSDVEVYTIDGSVSKQRRLEIEQGLRQPGKRMLLLVSGQTADVGVDFSAAQEVFDYNESWSLYEKRQRHGRVYRPGLKDKLVTRTFITEGTIEQGIHAYIESKYQAAEKLLRGIPVTEIEKEMLRQGEKQVDPDIETNQELAKYYFSSWDKMMKIYGYVKELGEEDFKKFLAHYDREYADSYADLVGSRSYQANVARLSGSLISAMAREKGQRRDAVRVLDLASGPEMLRRHMPEDLADRVVSVDINRHHFTQPGKKAVGSFVNLPIADKSVEYVNLSLALHYTRFVPSKGNYERLKVLQEVNRVLVNGGRATISMIYSLSLDDTQALHDAIGKLGLRVVQAYSGDASAGRNFQSQVLTLEKVEDCSADTRELAKIIGTEGLRALKFKKVERTLTNSRKIVQAFSLDGKTFSTELNDRDRAVLAEEEQVTAELEGLRRLYGTIEDIPKTDIYRNGLARIFNGKRYVLFKRLKSDSGAVVIR
jgi:SAM-dependent methyltransferase